jgi:hypothetical protein
MTYFDCFVVGSWMFALGWFLGAVYMQNHNEETANEETQSPRVSQEPERCPECEAWRLPAGASAAAD